MTKEFIERQRRLGWDFDIEPLETVANHMAADKGFRLYLMRPLSDWPGIVVTVCLVAGAMHVDTNLMTDEARIVPSDWLAFAGKREFPHDAAVSFQAELARAGAWDLPDCDAGSRDGDFFLHLVTDGTRTHQIRMFNPDVHEDNRYRILVNVYSQAFLSGIFEQPTG